MMVLLSLLLLFLLLLTALMSLVALLNVAVFVCAASLTAIDVAGEYCNNDNFDNGDYRSYNATDCDGKDADEINGDGDGDENERNKI